MVIFILACFLDNDAIPDVMHDECESLRYQSQQNLNFNAKPPHMVCFDEHESVNLSQKWIRP